jgi:hypothetical protein
MINLLVIWVIEATHCYCIGVYLSLYFYEFVLWNWMVQCLVQIKLWYLFDELFLSSIFSDFFFSSNEFCFKTYFIGYKYHYSCLHSNSIFLDYYLPFFHFHSGYIFRNEFFGGSIFLHLIFNPFIHSVSFNNKINIIYFQNHYKKVWLCSCHFVDVLLSVLNILCLFFSYSSLRFDGLLYYIVYFLILICISTLLVEIILLHAFRMVAISSPLWGKGFPFFPLVYAYLSFYFSSI